MNSSRKKRSASSRDGAPKSRNSRSGSRSSGRTRYSGGSKSGGGRGGSSYGRGRGGSRKQSKEIPVHKLIHEGVPVIETVYEHKNDYADFPLHPDLKRNLENLGYTAPTAVQELSFEAVSNFENVLAIANTGTGKTAAFLIPTINNMLNTDEQFSSLVIVPTRELALQVQEEFRRLTKGLRMYSTSLIGGQNIGQDFKRLQKFNHFIIGTPGRLVDLTKRGALKFDNFEVLVLDEFDRMLDMGFSQDVDFLTDKLSHRQQTLLFSATLDKNQQSLINKLMPKYHEFRITDGNKTAEHINQDVIYSTREDKFDTLLSMLQKDSFEKTLVFAETKRLVGKVAKELKAAGIKVDEIHGDKSQGYRKNALKAFRSGRVKVLVATDVAARGLDINDVSHVINYEQPQDYETYIHRIGRTGRAGKGGKAFTFVDERKRRSAESNRSERSERSNRSRR